jgi:outer membrane lipoprotein-sorting protein
MGGITLLVTSGILIHSISIEAAPTVQENSISDKMINAIDNYKDIQGTYHIIEKPIDVDQTVTFKIKEGSAPGSYVKVVDNPSGLYEETHADGDSMLSYTPSKNEFHINKVDKNTFQKINGPRVSKNDRGEIVYIHRQDPSLASIASDVTFPENYGFWLKAPNAQYNVVGHENILNRDATVIEGKMDPYVGQKHHATDFKMWVDSETGVLLKLIETDANNNNEITNQIIVNDIKFNQGNIDTSDFKITPPKGAIDTTYKQKFNK